MHTTYAVARCIEKHYRRVRKTGFAIFVIKVSAVQEGEISSLRIVSFGSPLVSVHITPQTGSHPTRTWVSQYPEVTTRATRPNSRRLKSGNGDRCYSGCQPVCARMFRLAAVEWRRRHPALADFSTQLLSF